MVLSQITFSQETYTINNETLELKTEIDGQLDLLWNIIDGKYRYFVRDADANIQELINTKGSDNKFQEEYKSILSDLTKGSNLSTDKVNLTLFSLTEFLNDYNVTKDSGYTSRERAQIMSRLGVFGGLTNSPFVENPENKSTPFFGAEFEIFEANRLPRHAGIFSIRHTLEHDDFKYSNTQLALGYRYRVINQPNFNIYGNLKFVTYNFTDYTFVNEDPDNPGTFITDEGKSSDLDTPFIIGLGADIKISENSYITFAYHEIFALFLDSQGNFPIDFAIGFKLNL